jgi:class III poly(R)-hydroxyalkanoic acid synthase PhaE subunit
LLAALAEPLTALQSLPDWAGLAMSAQPWTSLFSGHVPGEQGKPVGANQLQLGIERTFGGLGEAFGLGPMRELQQAWREMLTAGIAKQRSQAEYLAIAVQAWVEGTQGLLQELQAMGARGERVESLLAFIRLWAKAIDGPMHDAMQNGRGLQATAKLIGASTQYRQQLQKAIGLASEAMYVPTRADMDNAFREIQELKRELRRLKKALPPAAQKRIVQAREQTA